MKVLVGYPERAGGAGDARSGCWAASRPTTPASYGIDAVADARGAGAAARRRAPGAGGADAWWRTSPRSCAPPGARRSLTLGASPRGSVALLKMAQAAALLDGRAYVVPDDVKALAPAVLRHRITVAPELELEGVTAGRGASRDHREDGGPPVMLVPSRRWLLGRRRWRWWRPLGAAGGRARSALLLAARRCLGRGCSCVDACARSRRPRARRPRARRRPRSRSAGRFVVRYRWSHRGARRLAVLVRERLPEPLGGAVTRRSAGWSCRRA